MLWKLLSKHISFWQTLLACVATLLGVVVIAAAVQAYADFDASRGSNANDPFDPSGVVMIAPVTSGSGLLSRNVSDIDTAMLASLRAQTWVRRIDAVAAPDFEVSLSMDFGGKGYSTSLFFEGIADEFIANAPAGWGFDPSNPKVSIILPAEYLALYNFGFAPSRNLPAISPSLISMMPLEVTVTGVKGQLSLPCRVVGFSSTISTIAVPKGFVVWANRRLGSGDTPANRLIAEVTEPGNPAMEQTLSGMGLHVIQGDVSWGEGAYIVKILARVVICVGIVIALLALGMMLLSVALMMTKNRTTIVRLRMLGYTSGQIAAPYARFFGGVLGACGAFGIVLVWWLSRLWRVPLEQLQMAPQSIGVAVATVISILLLLWLVTVFLIFRKASH